MGRSHAELDLCDSRATDAFFAAEKPEFVFLSAAKVGGIGANQKYPVDFLENNLEMQTNVTRACNKHGVKKLMFLGSSCIYPKDAPQPMNESALMTGPLEPTNQWYSMAKITGILLIQAYRQQYGLNGICVQPTNLYGPKDNYDLASAHVLPATIRKAHEAKNRGDEEFKVWGTGKAMREFLHIDDLADACVFLMQTYDDEAIVNIGTGKDVTIRELATQVCKTVGFKGKIVFDTTKTDGTPRKLLDVSKLKKLGWSYTIDLEEGIKGAYQDYLNEHVNNK